MSSNASSSRPLWAHALLLPVYLVYGTWDLLRLLFGVPARVRALRSTLDDTLHCPHGHPNPALGRFECGACHATYHGWVGRCELCGAGARWVACDVCQISIPLPWERS